jgi:hypothetical protein
LVLAAIFISFVRRALFVTGIIVFVHLPSFAIFNFNFNILFYAMFLHYFDLYYEKTTKYKAISGEYVNLLVNYCLFEFTEFATIEQSMIMGNVVVIIVSVNLIVSFVSLSVSALLLLTKSIKVAFVNRRNKRHRKVQALIAEEKAR